MKTLQFFTGKSKLLALGVTVAAITVILGFVACEQEAEPPVISDPPSYTVVYDKNGGSGTMENSVHIIGSAKNLNANTFIRTDYTFMGWAELPLGAVKYIDGQSVSDLSTVAGVTVRLYAVWKILVPGASLAGKLAWLQTNAQSNTDYTIAINANEWIEPAVLSYSGKTNIGITLVGTVTEWDIGLLSNGAMFTVNAEVTLTLGNNITLRGRSNNNTSLVRINSGGTLIMNVGSHITGNTTSSGIWYEGYGGGVFVGYNGTFTMNGGTISGNFASSNDLCDGGGVFVNSNGTFTMNGGTISGNAASYSGGGVCLEGGTFTMSGGEISGNTASSSGGGVYITSNLMGVVSSGTFTMSGGEISGNTASGSGGGVYVSVYTTFTMSGGEISGNTASGSGGGVYVDRGTFHIVTGTVYGSNEANAAIRNTAATNGAALCKYNHSLSTAQYGTFSGITWNGIDLPLPNTSGSGYSTYTDNTIKVVDGILQ
jgi:hypothetical protein